jgi:hypothetical protein
LVWMWSKPNLPQKDFRFVEIMTWFLLHYDMILYACLHIITWF